MNLLPSLTADTHTHKGIYKKGEEVTCCYRERESIRKYINGIKYSSILPTVYTAEDTRLSVLVIIIDWPLRWFASFVSTKETTAETREPKEEEELLPNFFLFPFF